MTYRDVVIPGSGLLSRLLAQIQGDGLVHQACDMSPIDEIIKKKPFDRYGWVPWTLQYLQFARKSALLCVWTIPFQRSVPANL
jgi:hypothetical protein